jgi:hypothetical protein
MCDVLAFLSMLSLMYMSFLIMKHNFLIVQLKLSISKNSIRNNFDHLVSKMMGENFLKIGSHMF